MLNIVTATPIDAPLGQALAWTDILTTAAAPEPALLAGLLGLVVLVCAAIAWLTPAARPSGRRRSLARDRRLALSTVPAEAVR